MHTAMAPVGVGGGWPAQPPKKGMPVWLIVLLVLIPVLVGGVGIMAVLGIYGTRKYIANAKTAEAKNVLGQLGKDAVAAYEGEHLDRNGNVTRRLCPSASARVPADRTVISGRKYQSSAAEWTVDSGRNAGFACLKFEMSAPQYFQYEYEATETSFVARAYGDMNGDGVFSTFELKGQIVDGRLVIAPSILETNPFE